MNDKIQIFQALNQAALNATDFTNPKHTGVLHSEKGKKWLEFTINDGFKIKFLDNMAMILYQVQVNNELTHNRIQFDADCEYQLKQIVSYLQKEYKKITGKSISLTLQGDISVTQEQISMIRKVVTASGRYKISGVESTFDKVKKDTDEHQKKSLDKIEEPKKPKKQTKSPNFKE